MNQYKELCEKWRQIFLEMDLEEVLIKLPFLHLTEEYLEDFLSKISSAVNFTN